MRFGLPGWLYYFQKVVGLPGVPEQGTPEECLDAMIEAGFVVVGTPDDLISPDRAPRDSSAAGFGAFLVTAHEWANRAATRRSYELIARYVMPRFQDSNAYTRSAACSGCRRIASRSSAPPRRACWRRSQKDAEDASPVRNLLICLSRWIC